MLQVIQGEEVYVVDLDVMPPELELPIVATSLEEVPYAQALTLAIEWGTITEPGKYAIRMGNEQFDIFLILSEATPN